MLDALPDFNLVLSMVSIVFWSGIPGSAAANYLVLIRTGKIDEINAREAERRHEQHQYSDSNNPPDL